MSTDEQNNANEGQSILTVGLGNDARHRHEIIADLVQARKDIYDLREALNEIILLHPDEIERAYIIAGQALAPKVPNVELTRLRGFSRRSG